MFDLVADVEQYPRFLPLCEALQVRRRAREGRASRSLVADMSVGYKAIRETFTSRVTLDRTELHILVEYLEGPFSYLENRWTFGAEGAAAASSSSSSTTNSSSLTLGMLMGAMFDRAFRKFTDAFETRADAIYGQPGRWRASRRLGQRPFQEAERVLDRVAAHRRAPEVAVASLQVNGRADPARPARNAPARPACPRVAPPGPAMPVTATATSAWERTSAPCAIARATASLTAPCSAMRSADTPSISALA